MEYLQKGRLYIVATPIGNLSDITFRALEILKKCDLILAEDTRRSIKLLSHYEIRKPLLSYRDQNHDKVFPQILRNIQLGKSIALLSDSGTPLVSDPGFKLVNELIKHEINIEAIPGPCAAIAALSVSGLPTDKFLFLGFLPKGSQKRIALLKKYKEIDATIIIYESPFRIKKLLTEALEVFGERQATVTNELTKKWEKIYRGNFSQIIKNLKNPRGEYTVLIKKMPKDRSTV